MYALKKRSMLQVLKVPGCDMGLTTNTRTNHTQHSTQPNKAVGRATNDCCHGTSAHHWLPPRAASRSCHAATSLGELMCGCRQRGTRADESGGKMHIVRSTVAMPQKAKTADREPGGGRVAVGAMGQRGARVWRGRRYRSVEIVTVEQKRLSMGIRHERHGTDNPKIGRCRRKTRRLRRDQLL